MPVPDPSSGVIDWQVVAGGIATFCTTAYIALKGWKDRKKDIQEAPTAIVGGVLQDNVNMVQNTASLVDLKEEVRDLQQLMRDNTAAINRLCDIMILTSNSSRR